MNWVKIDPFLGGYLAEKSKISKNGQKRQKVVKKRRKKSRKVKKWFSGNPENGPSGRNCNRLNYSSAKVTSDLGPPKTPLLGPNCRGFCWWKLDPTKPTGTFGVKLRPGFGGVRPMFDFFEFFALKKDENRKE